MKRDKGVTTYPSWAPAELIEALRQWENAPAEQEWYRWWEVDDDIEDWTERPPIDYLRGVGFAHEVHAIVKKLVFSPKMKSVWHALEGLTRRDGKRLSSLWPEKKGIVSCVIARRCALALHQLRMHSVTQKQWSERHRKIAKTARQLSGLLQEGPEVDEGLQNPLLFIPKAHAQSIATTLVCNLFDPPISERVLEIESRKSAAIERGETYQLTPEEVEIDNADEEAFQREVTEVEYWLHDAFSREGLAFGLLLNRLAQFAELASKMPPRTARHKNEKERLIYAISDQLVLSFRRMYGKPCYELVSTIIHVIVGKTKTAGALKQRHDRLKGGRPLIGRLPEIWNPKLELGAADKSR